MPTFFRVLLCFSTENLLCKFFVVGIKVGFLPGIRFNTKYFLPYARQESTIKGIMDKSQSEIIKCMLASQYGFKKSYISLGYYDEFEIYFNVKGIGYKSTCLSNGLRTLDITISQTTI